MAASLSWKEFIIIYHISLYFILFLFKLDNRAPGTYVNPWEHEPHHQQLSDPTEWRAINSSPNNKMDPGSSMTNVYTNNK